MANLNYWFAYGRKWTEMIMNVKGEPDVILGFYLYIYI